ncbi:MAG: hypothetical protein DMG78_14840 [Acidobacteria bacterium]|nr:MAG: hypothetical protein DMG78_14840 [Acidobacteriota bacterium]
MGTPAQRLESERFQFPGMAPREVLIWRQWLALHQHEYTGWQYNVHIGNGIDPGPSYPQVYRDQYIFNTQKRLDALAFQGEQPFVFEVKDRATGSSMSQLLAYKALWPVTFPNTPAPVLVLVTNRVSADMPMVLDATGIRLDLVDNVDFSVLQPVRPKGPFMPRG